MNKTKAALTGLALLAATTFAGCATTEPRKQSSNVGVEFYWNTRADAESNEITGRYLPPLIIIPLPNNNAYKNK